MPFSNEQCRECIYKIINPVYIEEDTSELIACLSMKIHFANTQCVIAEYYWNGMEMDYETHEFDRDAPAVQQRFERFILEYAEQYNISIMKEADN